MKITKFGHSCVLVQENGVKIIIDPGIYSTQQNEIGGVDVVLITHDHQDHCDKESLQAILFNNPHAKIITNHSVGIPLQQEGFTVDIIEHGQSITIGGVVIEGEGNEHAMLHSSIPAIQNTGYWINRRLFFPGDALTVPSLKVEILAIPLAGPWVKISEAIDYAIQIHPTMSFPVHDGILKSDASIHRLASQVLETRGVPFMPLEIDKEYDF